MSAAPAAADLAVGDLAPDFELLDLDGAPHRLSELAGRWTVLVFTTTWCPYCVAEAPYLEAEIAQRFRARGVNVVVVDVKEPPEVARQLPERFGWTMPFLIDSTGHVSETFAPKKEGLSPEVAVINAHFVLDSERVIRFVEYLNMERFDIRATAVVEAIEALLAEGEAR